MRILITDDQARRYARLTQALQSVGVDRSMIDMASCAQDARELLGRNKYDILILDILLPLWAEGDPSLQHSLDLLTDIHQGNDLVRPSRILGITADLSLTGNASRSFEREMWTIVEYSDSNDEWVKRVVNCVRYSLENIEVDEKSVEHKVDLAIVCALADPELDEVLKLPWNWTASRPIDDQTFVHDGYFDLNERRITVCATSVPRMGMVATALRSSTLINILRPKILAMCGICAGVRGKVELGDVLLADPAWDFQSGKRVRDGANAKFVFSPHQLYSSPLIRSHIEQIKQDRQALTKLPLDFKGDRFRVPDIVIGPVASGSAVLADGSIVEEIKVQHRDLVGVEMEIYGMYSAAVSASVPQPLVFALKGVCDFADPEKTDGHQRYAAFASANVLRILMERFGDRLLI